MHQLMWARPRAMTDNRHPGAASLTAFRHASMVEPVVITSSTINTCLPSRLPASVTL